MLRSQKRFGNETCSLSNQLLSFYYQDYEQHYSGLQIWYFICILNLAPNLNTFAEEDLLGHLSKHKHGTQYWGDLLAFYYNVSNLLCRPRRLLCMLDGLRSSCQEE